MARLAWAVALGLLAADPPPFGMIESGNRAAPELPVAAAKASRRSPPFFAELAVPGYADAIVAVPARIDGRARPLVVATHGAWDRPEWHCELWRRMVQDRAFVLCPRGRPTVENVPADEQLFYYPDHLELSAEIEHAIAALAARFGGAVDVTRPVFAGFSQGAIDGALLLPRHPARFARAVLVEGGNGEFDEWGRLPASRFARAGGERVLLACGRAHCATAGVRSARVLVNSGVDARVLYVPGVGHAYDGAMEEGLTRTLAWLVDGDSRWR